MLPFSGGAERVLEAVLGVYPSAPIYTLFYNLKLQQNAFYHMRSILIRNRLPGTKTRYRQYLPCYGDEQFDLSDYEILSFNYAAARDLPRPEQLHISPSYAHPPA
jgi:hypothetical protein